MIGPQPLQESGTGGHSVPPWTRAAPPPPLSPRPGAKAPSGAHSTGQCTSLSQAPSPQAHLRLRDYTDSSQHTPGFFVSVHV